MSNYRTEKLNTVQTALLTLGIPVAYYQFRKEDNINGQSAFCCYYEDDKDIFLADDTAYDVVPHIVIELYTVNKEIELEQNLIDALNAANLPFNGGGTTYIDNEKLYETIFYC